MLSNLRENEWIYWTLAVGFGVLVGYVDVHEKDVQLPVLLILAGAFVLGFLRRRGVWRRALVVGAGVPLAHLASQTFGHVPPYATSLPGTFLALIPAFIGAYVGVLAGMFVKETSGGIEG